MAHFIDTQIGEGQDWYWLGDDLDDFDIELNANVEIERDMLGGEYIIHEDYEPEADSDVFYAREDDAMFELLQNIIDNMLVGSGCTTFALEVHLWETPTYGSISLATGNPKKKDWYEYKNGNYVLSNDTTADPNKTYYYAQYPAVRRRCYIIPTSFGGDTSGYQIPFTIKYFNDPNYPVVSGLFDISEMEFNII